MLKEGQMNNFQNKYTVRIWMDIEATGDKTNVPRSNLTGSMELQVTKTGVLP